MTPEALNTETITVKQRLVTFCKSQGISVREFERRCGFRYGYVSSIRISVTPERLGRIKQAFPAISTDWVMCGTGEMLEAERVDDTGIRKLLASIESLTETVASQQKAIAILSEQIADLKKASF